MKFGKEWLSISDMMTGLMIIFLFISVTYIQQSLKNFKKVDKALKQNIKNKDIIHKALCEEFHKDLPIWNAELIKDSLVIRFLSPQIMFNPGKIIIKPKFKKILSDFCPRYLKLLYEFSFIDGIRIEGHTSREWKGLPPEEAYFENMALSQGRTRSVLKYCVTIESLNAEIKKWAVKHFTANGLASSRPICVEDTVRCRTRNRRVAFRVQIKPLEILIKDSKNNSLKDKPHLPSQKTGEPLCM